MLKELIVILLLFSLTTLCIIVYETGFMSELLQQKELRVLEIKEYQNPEEYQTIIENPSCKIVIAREDIKKIIKTTTACTVFLGGGLPKLFQPSLAISNSISTEEMKRMVFTGGEKPYIKRIPYVCETDEQSQSLISCTGIVNQSPENQITTSFFLSPEGRPKARLLIEMKYLTRIFEVELSSTAGEFTQIGPPACSGLDITRKQTDSSCLATRVVQEMYNIGMLSWEGWNLIWLQWKLTRLNELTRQMQSSMNLGLISVFAEITNITDVCHKKLPKLTGLSNNDMLIRSTHEIVSNEQSKSTILCEEKLPLSRKLVESLYFAESNLLFLSLITALVISLLVFCQIACFDAVINKLGLSREPRIRELEMKLNCLVMWANCSCETEEARKALEMGMKH